jgi:hypothetical protein
MLPRIAMLFAILLSISTVAGAQGVGGCPGPFNVEQLIFGKVIVPVAGLDKNVEVLLFEESQLHVHAYTNGSGEYRFPYVSPGRFELVVRIEGFKEHREKVEACDFRPPPTGQSPGPGLNTYNVFMNFEVPPIPFLVVDFSLELKEAVDLAELRGVYPKPVIDEFRKAQADRLSGFFKTAEERLQKLVTAVPEFYEAHMLLGSNYLDRKNFRQAEAEFNRSLELKPGSPVPLLALGSLYLVEVDAAVSPQPGDAGLILAENDIPLILDDARDALERAVKVKPDAAFAHYLLGVTYHKSSVYGRSEASFKKALELDAKLRWTRIALANLYLRLGRLPEVVEQLDIYLKDYPDVQNRFEVQEMRKRIAKTLPAEKK